MRTLAVAIVALSVGVASAQQAPRAPVVGAATNAPDDGTADAKAARRAVMRDTQNRQYTPEEMDEFRRMIDAYDRSKAGVYSEAVKVVKRRVQVGLSSDAQIHEIRLNAENIGSVVFTDSLGNPWNVEDVVVPNFLSASKSGNMVILRPSAGQTQTGQVPVRFGRGSVTFLLEGLNSTVPFSIAYGFSREIDGQVEAQLQARNPRAPVNAVQGGNIEADDLFGLFLDGEPPREALKLRTSLKSVEAWAYLGRLYVRTQLALHSPAFRMFGSSASGMSVYRFDRAPSIINAIADGAIVAVAIGE